MNTFDCQNRSDSSWNYSLLASLVTGVYNGGSYIATVVTQAASSAISGATSGIQYTFEAPSRAYNNVKISTQAGARKLGIMIGVNQLHTQMDKSLKDVHLVTILHTHVASELNEEGNIIEELLDSDISNLTNSHIFSNFIDIFLGKFSGRLNNASIRSSIINKLKKPVNEERAIQKCEAIRTKAFTSETGEFTNRNVIKVSNILMDTLTAFFTAVNSVETTTQVEMNDADFVDAASEADEEGDIFYDALEQFPTTKSTATAQKELKVIQAEWLEKLGIQQNPEEFIKTAKIQVRSNLGFIAKSLVLEQPTKNKATELFYKFISNIVSALIRFIAPKLIDSTFEVFTPEINARINALLNEELNLPFDQKRKILTAIMENQELFFWFFLQEVTTQLTHFDKIADTPESLDEKFSNFVRAIEPTASIVYPIIRPSITNKIFNQVVTGVSYIGVSNMKDLSELLADLKPSEIILPKLSEHLDRMTDSSRVYEEFTECVDINQIPGAFPGMYEDLVEDKAQNE